MRAWETMQIDPRDARSGRFGVRRLRRAMGFARQHRFELGLYLSVSVLSSIGQALPPLLYMQIVDKAIIPKRPDMLLEFVGLLAALSFANATLVVISGWLGISVGTGIVVDMRQALYDRIQRMPIGFFSRVQTGKVESRLNSDVGQAHQLFTATVGTMVANAVMVATTLALMIRFNWVVGLVTAGLIPALLIPSDRVARRIRRLTHEQMQHTGEMNALVGERVNTAGALLVKLFGGYRREQAQFGRVVGRIRDASVEQYMASMVFVASMLMAGSLAVLATYGFGGWSVIGGTMSLGTLVALTSLVQRLYAPAVDLAASRVSLAAGLVAFDRVFEILDTPLLVTDRSDAVALPLSASRTALSVEFDSVWFRYPSPDEFIPLSLRHDSVAQATAGELPWALRDVSLQVAAGTMTAIVGPSGAGKTTLCNLVPRLYDVSQGCVRIAGRDVRDVSRESLVDAVGVVTQDAYFFNDTIANNLRYARPEATMDDIAAACRAAHIDHVIESLEHGYDTLMGERGYRFSGGEKQRIAIARVLLSDPAVVILDEATSHLDSETELLVQQALGEVLLGRTSLVIAHRLSTVRAADQIVVVDNGEVVECGTHPDLLARDGLYAALYEAQFAGGEAARPALWSPSLATGG